MEKRERAERQREKDAFPYDQRTEKVSSAYGMIGRDLPPYSSEFFLKVFLRISMRTSLVQIDLAPI